MGRRRRLIGGARTSWPCLDRSQNYWIGSSPTAHVGAAEPAGCGYWRRATSGVFIHGGRAGPVGAHTHNVPLSDGAGGIDGTHRHHGGAGVPDHGGRRADPHRTTPLDAVYAPLDAAPVPPDVVLVRGNAWQLMLLAEAGRPPVWRVPDRAWGWRSMPEAINAACTSASFGCVGNRVYTGASDGPTSPSPGHSFTLLRIGNRSGQPGDQMLCRRRRPIHRPAKMTPDPAVQMSNEAAMRPATLAACGGRVAVSHWSTPRRVRNWNQAMLAPASTSSKSLI